LRDAEESADLRPTSTRTSAGETAAAAETKERLACIAEN